MFDKNVILLGDNSPNSSILNINPFMHFNLFGCHLSLALKQKIFFTALAFLVYATL